MDYKFFLRTPFLMFFIALVTWLVYFNSLQVPFYFDDIRSISNNQLLQTGTFSEIARTHGMRAVAYLSFALDYKISGEMSQFHITNILVHMFNGLLVYGLFWLLLFKTPNGLNFSPDKTTNFVRYLPLIAALLFIVHPLHSQAVTYIVQRSASLAALFYLAAICSYLLLKYQPKLIVKIAIGLFFIFFLTMGLLTKQNTVTLPLVIIALELTLFNHLKLKHLVITFLSLLSLMVITYLINAELLTDSAILLDKLTRENDVYSRSDYLLSQLNVLWIYIAKFFVPFSIRLEYPYQINTFPLWQSLIAGIAHLIVISLSVVYRKRASIVCFGILFYYLAHIVESSLIPIQDLAVEHRAYLPDVGLIIAILSGFYKLLFKIGVKPKTAVVTIVIPLLIMYSTITVKRNFQWLDPIAFYQYELSLSPNNCRILNNLADNYYKVGKDELAHPLIERCILTSSIGLSNPEMANNYLSMLVSTKQYTKADVIGKKALEQVTDVIAKRRILANMGIFKLQQNLLPEAESYFKQAVKLPNAMSNTFFALSLTLAKQGKLKEAHSYVEQGLKLSPNDKRGLTIYNRITVMLGSG